MMPRYLQLKLELSRFPSIFVSHSLRVPDHLILDYQLFQKHVLERFGVCHQCFDLFLVSLLDAVDSVGLFDGGGGQFTLGACQCPLKSFDPVRKLVLLCFYHFDELGRLFCCFNSALELAA